MKNCLIIMLLFTVLSAGAQNDTLYLSLDDCRNLATEKNADVRISGKQVNIAENYRKSAKTQYFGQLNVIGKYQYTNKPFQVLSDNVFMPVVPFWSIDQSTMDLSSSMLENPLLNGIVINPETGEVVTDPDGNPLFFFYSYLPSEGLTFGTHHNMFFGPVFTQPLYMGGKIRNMNKLAESGVRLAAYNYEIEKSEVIYKTDEAYWRCLDLQEKEALSLKYLEYLTRLLYDLENLYEEGLITYENVLNVRTKINEVELQKLQIDNGLILSEMALCQILGLDVNQDLYLTDTVALVSLVPDFSTAVETGLSNRNEINLLNEAYEMTLANEKISRSRFLPNASLSANYLFINPNPYGGFENEFAGDWTVGLSVQIPVTHWGDRIYTIRSSQELTQIAQIKKEDAESLISMEIRQTIFKYTEAVKELDLYEESLVLAEEQYRIVNDKYLEGMATLNELLEAAAKLQNAKMKLVEAKTKMRLMETEYRQKTGQL